MPSKIINPYSCFLSRIGYFYFFVYFLIIKFPIAPESIITIPFFPLILIAILKYILIIVISKTILFSSCWLLLSVNFRLFPIFHTNIYFFYNQYHLNKIRTIFSCNNTPNSKIVYTSSNIFICNNQACRVPLTITFITIVLTQIILILKILDNNVCR